jgi:predicted nucleic acid-binding protein
VNIYLDASVVLRMLLKDPSRIRGWEPQDTKVASVLLEVECLRTLDSLRLRGVLGEAEVDRDRESLVELLRATDIIEVSPPILRRASEPLTVPLRTLDAIHLASALVWCEANGEKVTMATHDAELARAARSKGLEVIGV